MDHRHGYRDGFTLIEIMVVLGLIGVLSGFAIMVAPRLVQESKSDGEMKRIMAELRRARDVAVSQRRSVLVEFPSTNQIQIVRRDVTYNATTAAYAETGRTVLETVGMEAGVTYRQFAEIGIDTPDLFGRTSAQSFGTATQIMFTSEGTFVDQTGDPVNGTIYIGILGQPLTARAITVFGPTALIRGYRWDGRKWTL